MKVLAIDAGFVMTGWAIIESTNVVNKWMLKAYGSIKTERNTQKGTVRVADDDTRRMVNASRELQQVIENHKPNVAAIEIPSGGAKSATACRAMALATSMCAIVCDMMSLPTEYYSPRETRLAGAGKPNASKNAVIDGASEYLWTIKEIRTQKEREAVGDAIATFMAANKYGTLLKMAWRKDDGA